MRLGGGCDGFLRRFPLGSWIRKERKFLLDRDRDLWRPLRRAHGRFPSRWGAWECALAVGESRFHSARTRKNPQRLSRISRASSSDSCRPARRCQTSSLGGVGSLVVGVLPLACDDGGSAGRLLRKRRSGRDPRAARPGAARPAPSAIATSAKKKAQHGFSPRWAQVLRKARPTRGADPRAGPTFLPRALSLPRVSQQPSRRGFPTPLHEDYVNYSTTSFREARQFRQAAAGRVRIRPQRRYSPKQVFTLRTGSSDSALYRTRFFWTPAGG